MYAWWHQAHVCMFFVASEMVSGARATWTNNYARHPHCLYPSAPLSRSLFGGEVSEQKAFSHRGSSLLYAVRRIAVSHLQYVERLSPGNPKLGWRMHPACWQRRDATLIIPAFLCLAQ